MANNTLNGVIQRYRREALARDGVGTTDGELLGRFVEGHDEGAFAALLHRHGPMVLGVCRRVLHNEADAEDAFQATFLVLVTKAATVQPREMVGNWLFGVAHNTALKAKAMNTRRREREREAGTVTRREARDEVWQEVLALLDAELGGLPDKYRAPIVLCDLEGKTIAEAAAQLGWPQGTLATRLRRGRELLAGRLSGRGLSLSAGVLATIASSAPTFAGVPAALAASTTKAAGLIAAGRAVTSGVVSTTVAALTQGVLKSMTLTKLKTTTALALGLLLCGLGGVVLARTGADRDGVVPVSAASPAADPPAGPKEAKPQPTDSDKLQGIWTGDVTEHSGVPTVADRLKQDALNPGVGERPNAAFYKVQVLIKGDKLTVRGRFHFPTGNVFVGGSRTDTHFAFKVDAAKTPKWIDLPLPPAPDDVKPLDMLGLYELDGDNLTLCLNGPNKKRPAGFKTQERTGQMLLVLKRDPKAKWEELPKSEPGLPPPVITPTLPTRPPPNAPPPAGERE